MNKKQSGYILLTLLFMIVGVGALFFTQTEPRGKFESDIHDIKILETAKKNILFHAMLNEGRIPCSATASSVGESVCGGGGNLYPYASLNVNKPLDSFGAELIYLTNPQNESGKSTTSGIPTPSTSPSLVAEIFTPGKYQVTTSTTLSELRALGEYKQIKITREDWYSKVAERIANVTITCINQFKKCDRDLSQQLISSAISTLYSNRADSSFYWTPEITPSAIYSWDATYLPPASCSITSTPPNDGICNTAFNMQIPSNPSIGTLPSSNYTISNTNNFFIAWQPYMVVYSLPSQVSLTTSPSISVMNNSGCAKSSDLIVLIKNTITANTPHTTIAASDVIQSQTSAFPNQIAFRRMNWGEDTSLNKFFTDYNCY